MEKPQRQRHRQIEREGQQQRKYQPFALQGEKTQQENRENRFPVSDTIAKDASRRLAQREHAGEQQRGRTRYAAPAEAAQHDAKKQRQPAGENLSRRQRRIIITCGIIIHEILPSPPGRNMPAACFLAARRADG